VSQDNRTSKNSLAEKLRLPAMVFYEYSADNGALLREAADEIDRLTERLAGAYASVNLLTEMLEAKAPQEATESRPVFDYERFSKDFKEAVPFVAPRMEPQTPTHQQLFSGINHFAREILRLTDTVPADCAPHEPQGWQPIETAPKGLNVLVAYQNKLGKWRMVRACYYEAGTLMTDDSVEEPYCDENGYAHPGWYEECESQEYINPCDEEPTLWHPLPSAPSTKGGAHGS